jgi:S1-C subfamily serine protease
MLLTIFVLTTTGYAEQVGGATIDNLTPRLAEQLGFPPMTPAVVVTDVDPSSAAGAAGLLPGDVIVAVNNIGVESVTDLKDTIWRTGLDPVVFSVIRDGVGYIFTFPLR